VAYIKDLAVQCATCEKKATKEVIDRWNGSLGKFCSACAKRKLKAKLKTENEERRE
jgi:hypothetical protein